MSDQSTPSTELRKLEGEIEERKSRGIENALADQLITIAKALEAERDDVSAKLNWATETGDDLTMRNAEVSARVVALEGIIDPLRESNTRLKRQLDEAMKALRWFSKSAALGFTANKMAFDTITEIEKL